MARKKAARRPIKKTNYRSRRTLFGYPLVIFLLLCAGVFLLMATFPSLADDIRVTAKVSGPLVTDPAVITSPAGGQRFSALPIDVEGTCPANASYIEIYRNSIMSGSAICDSNDRFQISMDLFAGANSLTAHVFNMTDDEGPVSAAVNVVYDASQPPAGGGQQTAGREPGRATGQPLPPLLAKTEFVYKGYQLGELVEWPIEISGGLLPYTADVDWGDGSSDIYQRPAAGEFIISHRYSRLPSRNRSFTIKVRATDAAGGQSYLQFFVLVTSKISSAPSASIFTKPIPGAAEKNWLWIAWPAYLALILMVICYWLGEREEIIVLKKKGLLKRRR